MTTLSHVVVGRTPAPRATTRPTTEGEERTTKSSFVVVDEGVVVAAFRRWRGGGGAWETGAPDTLNIARLGKDGDDARGGGGGRKMKQLDYTAVASLWATDAVWGGGEGGQEGRAEGGRTKR